MQSEKIQHIIENAYQAGHSWLEIEQWLARLGVAPVTAAEIVTHAEQEHDRKWIAEVRERGQHG